MKLPDQNLKGERPVMINLRGPFHPLETKYMCTHRIGSTKEVRIEQESVNSGKFQFRGTGRKKSNELLF